MKKLLICLILLLVTTSTAFAGGIWDMVKNSGMAVRTPQEFQLEVKGTNIRAYVFDVPEMKSICINMWGENNQQLECKTYKEIGER